MKIALVTPLNLAQRAGVETHVLRLAEALRAWGATVAVYGGGATEAGKLDPRQFDIIHTHGGLRGQYLRWVLARGCGARHVHTLHGVSIDYLLNCRAWLNWRCYTTLAAEGLLSRHADHTIAVSRQIAAQAQRCFALSPGRVTVIPNGYAPPRDGDGRRDELRRRLGLRCDNWAVLFVGRAEDKVKGVAALAAALDRLHARYRRVRLLAVPGTHWRAAPWLIAVGPTAHEEMTRLYAAADALVMASLNEGLPLVLVEAMGHGLPVVAPPVGGIAELVRPGRTGLLTRPDRGDLAEQMARLIERPEWAAALGAAGRRAVAGLTWREVARATLSLYERVLVSG